MENKNKKKKRYLLHPNITNVLYFSFIISVSKMALFQVQNNYFLFQSIMGIIGSILSYEEQTRMEPHDSEATLYQEYSFLWYNMVMIYLPAHGRISSVFRRVRPTVQN